MVSVILAALTANVGSSFSIFYEPKADRADLGEGWQMREIFTGSEDYRIPDEKVFSITFDYYNENGEYQSESGTLVENGGDEKLGNIDIFKRDTENSLVNIYVLSSLPIYAAYDSSYMFANLTMCSKFKFANFNTSEVENMNHLFYNTATAGKLTNLIEPKYALDLVDFDIRTCKDLQDMFTGYGEAFLDGVKIFVGENFRPDRARETDPNQKLFSSTMANIKGVKDGQPQAYSLSNSETWNDFLNDNGLSVIGFYAADFNAFMQRNIEMSFLGMPIPIALPNVNFLIFDKFQSDAETPGTYIDRTSGYVVARNYNAMLSGCEGEDSSQWAELGQVGFPFTTYVGYEDYILGTHKIYLGWNFLFSRVGVNYIYFLSDTQIYAIDGLISNGAYVSGRQVAEQEFDKAGMFANLPRINGFKFNNFNTELMEDMEYMFYHSATWGQAEDKGYAAIGYLKPDGRNEYEASYLELNLAAFDFSNVNIYGGFDCMFDGLYEEPCGVGYLYVNDDTICKIFNSYDYGYAITNSVLGDNWNYLEAAPCAPAYMYEPKPWE